MTDTGNQALAGVRILLAEDEMATAMAMTTLLEGEGCHVVKVARSPKGMAHLEAEASFDAAILDVTLADGPVYPLAGALVDKAVPVIFLTGYSAAQLPESWRQWPILEKPMNPDVLIDWLVRHARVHRGGK